LKVHCIGNEARNRHGKLAIARLLKCESSLLAINNPGGPRFPTCGNWDGQSSGHRVAVTCLWSADAFETDIRRESKDDCVRKERMTAVQILDDVLYVSSYLLALVAYEIPLVITSNSRDVGDFEDFCGGEREEIDRRTLDLA
jgi:hypothetical protein